MRDEGTGEHPWVAAGKGQLRFGTNLRSSGDWAKNRDEAQLIEDLGFDSGMCGEHPCLDADCWTTLAAYAAVTRTLRLVSISCVYYRSPQLLVRHATDIDIVSGGRLTLGLGAGWAKGDFDYLGIPFPLAAERVRYLEETIQSIRHIWSDPATVTTDLLGYTFTMQVNVKPFQQPYVPLLVAGVGAKILRQAAEYGDMVNLECLKVPSPHQIRGKFDLLDRFCDERKRPRESVIRSHFLNTVILATSKDEAETRLNALAPMFRDSGFFQAMTPPELISHYRSIIDAGANYLYYNQMDMDAPTLRLFAETVMPELREYYASTLAR